MKMRRMRVESLVINIKVLIVLFVLWYLLCDNCCVKVAGEVVSEYVFFEWTRNFCRNFVYGKYNHRNQLDYKTSYGLD